jgi:hypothetical protein
VILILINRTPLPFAPLDSLSTWALAALGALVGIGLIGVISLEILVVILALASFTKDTLLKALAKDYPRSFLSRSPSWSFVCAGYEVADSDGR